MFACQVPPWLIGQLKAMQVIDSLAKQGVAVVVRAEQHVDAGLPLLVVLFPQVVQLTTRCEVATG